MVFGLFEKDFNHRNSISQLVSHKIKKKVLSSSQFFAILAMERESLLVRCHLSNVDYIMYVVHKEFTTCELHTLSSTVDSSDRLSQDRLTPRLVRTEVDPRYGH